MSNLIEQQWTLYAPILDNQIQAFYKEDNITNTILKINYNPNPLVTEDTDQAFALKLYDGLGNPLNNGETILGKKVENKNCIEFNIFKNLPNGEKSPLIEEMKEGWYYKFQIAYCTVAEEETESEIEEIGAFTFIFTLKYAKKPTVTIEYDYQYSKFKIGYFTDDDDKVEYMKKFNLIIQKSDLSLEENSGDIEDDIYYYSKNNWEGNFEVAYTIYTINGLILQGDIEFEIEISDELEGYYSYSVITDEENGINNIKIKRENGNLQNLNLMIWRSKDNNYWECIGAEITIDKFNENYYTFYDTTLEAGQSYYYKIYHKLNSYRYYFLYNDEKKYFNDFQYIFLSDKERQLCIKFNGSIDNYKITIQENKIETIGSKYPRFFRNGKINYKEFSISGLISYWSDENKYFYNNPNLFYSLNRDKTDSSNTILSQETTNLTGINYKNEREFKNMVLNWLNNGKAKLLRTNAEGNYIVRLMNISMTPEKTLGRLIHNFSATAYEIADYTQEELEKNKVQFKKEE